MKTLIIVVVLIVFACAANASFVGTETNLSTDITTVKICVQEPLNQNGMGAFVFSCQNRYWSQAYAGLTYFRPSGEVNVEVALGYGIEQADDPSRLGGWVWAGKGKLSAIYLFEDGGSGPWTKLEAKYQLTSKISVGYVGQKYIGQGPLVEYQLDKGTSVKFYATDVSKILHLTQNF